MGIVAQRKSHHIGYLLRVRILRRQRRPIALPQLRKQPRLAVLHRQQKQLGEIQIDVVKYACFDVAAIQFDHFSGFKLVAGGDEGVVAVSGVLRAFQA